MSQNDPAVPPPAFSVLDELRQAVTAAEAMANNLGPLLAGGEGQDAIDRLAAEMAPLAGLVASAGPLPDDIAASLIRLRDRIDTAAAAGDGWLANAAAAQRVRRAYRLPP